MTQDPWADEGVASQPVDDGDFDSATTDYLTINDLDGRLLLVWAMEKSTESGTTGPYTMIVSDVVVLDGEITDTMRALGYQSVPFLSARMHLSNKQIAEKLSARVGNGKPLLTRVTSKPSKINRSVLAFWFSEPTEEDKGIARAYLVRPDRYRPSDQFNS